MEGDAFSRVLASFEVFLAASPEDRTRFSVFARYDDRKTIKQSFELIKVVETTKTVGSADVAAKLMAVEAQLAVAEEKLAASEAERATLMNTLDLLVKRIPH